GILVREWGALYGALAADAAGRPDILRVLPELPLQYPDYAVWQRRWLTGEVFERQLAWWRERLARAPRPLPPPAAPPRARPAPPRGPPGGSGRGAGGGGRPPSWSPPPPWRRPSPASPARREWWWACPSPTAPRGRPRASSASSSTPWPCPSTSRGQRASR